MVHQLFFTAQHTTVCLDAVNYVYRYVAYHAANNDYQVLQATFIVVVVVVVVVVRSCDSDRGSSSSSCSSGRRSCGSHSSGCSGSRSSGCSGRCGWSIGNVWRLFLLCLVLPVWPHGIKRSTWRRFQDILRNYFRCYSWLWFWERHVCFGILTYDYLRCHAW